MRVIKIVALNLMMILFYIGNSHGTVWQSWMDPFTSTIFGSTAEKVAVDRHENIYVGGIAGTNTAGPDDLVILKYNPGGEIIWSTIWNGPNDSDENLVDMEVDIYGNIYLGGTTQRDIESWYKDYFVLKLDSSGAYQWDVLYAHYGIHCDQLTDIALDQRGNVYVTGYCRLDLHSQHLEIVTIKYDRDGHQEWVAMWQSPEHLYNSAHAVTSDYKGNVYVAGCSWFGGETGKDCLLLKYSDSGELLWCESYDGTSYLYDTATEIAYDPRGFVYTSGTTANHDHDPTGQDIITLKYDEDGALLWDASHNSPYDREDVPWDIAVDPAGNLAVTGYSNNDQSYGEFTILKYSPDGTELWNMRHAGETHNFSYAIDVDSKGNVYVTGREGTLYTRYITTIRYNPDGAEEWLITSGGSTGNDHGNDINVALSGNIYVAARYSFYFTTIKYGQSNYSMADVGIDVEAFAPVQIPASGGSFAHTVTFTNNELSSMAAYFWSEITFPDGSFCGPVYGPAGVTLDPGTHVDSLRQQVPGWIPSGVSNYVVCFGEYPHKIWASDTLCIEKLEWGDGSIINDWSCSPLKIKGDVADMIGTEAPELLVHPNPFNATTVIGYDLGAGSSVSLRVFDLQGRQVAELVEGWQDAGYHEMTFDGTNLASGVYIYRIEMDNYRTSGKIILMK